MASGTVGHLAPTAAPAAVAMGRTRAAALTRRVAGVGGAEAAFLPEQLAPLVAKRGDERRRGSAGWRLQTSIRHC